MVITFGPRRGKADRPATPEQFTQQVGLFLVTLVQSGRGHDRAIATRAIALGNHLIHRFSVIRA